MLQLLWALNVLQSEMPPQSLSRYFNRLPAEAVRAKIGDSHFGLKWEIENLILLLLSTQKQKKASLRDYDYRSFGTAGHFLNLIKRVDESEEIFLLHTSGIDNAMQKLAHKQFFWQRPLLSVERLYRHYYVYGQGECAAYFQSKYGISIDEFAIACIALYMQFSMDAWQAPPSLPPELAPPEVMNRVLSMISKDIEEMRRHTRDRITTMVVNNSAKLAFLPSTLRQHPIISSKTLNGRMIAPLPQLLVFRATAGLYYDLSSGPQKLLEEANKRFEQYGKRLIEARCSRFEVLPEQQFGTKAHPCKTPDLLLKDEGRIKAAFECKATKLTFAAQYSDNPYAEASGAFAQIAKGMAQLWRFFSRARRRVYDKEPVDLNAYGVILTMDTWFHIATQLPDLFQAAEALVADEPDVQTVDKRSIIFCSIEELDEVLAVSDEGEFLETLQKSQLPEFAGWSLNNIRQPAGSEPLERKAYPFEIAEVLPLWDAIRKGP